MNDRETLVAARYVLHEWSVQTMETNPQFSELAEEAYRRVNALIDSSYGIDVNETAKALLKRSMSANSSPHSFVASMDGVYETEIPSDCY